MGLDIASLIGDMGTFLAADAAGYMRSGRQRTPPLNYRASRSNEQDGEAQDFVSFEVSRYRFRGAAD